MNRVVSNIIKHPCMTRSFSLFGSPDVWDLKRKNFKPRKNSEPMKNSKKVSILDTYETEISVLEEEFRLTRTIRMMLRDIHKSQFFKTIFKE